jgi:hypothetical protein
MSRGRFNPQVARNVSDPASAATCDGERDSSNQQSQGDADLIIDQRYSFLILLLQLRFVRSNERANVG